MGNSYNKKISDTTIRIGEVRFSYVYLFERRQNDDGSEGKFSVALLIPKSDTKAKALIEDAINAAKELGKSKKWNGKVPSNCKSPLHDGDDKDDPNYEGYWYINASNSKRPGVQQLVNGVRSDCLDEDDFYSGCYGAAVISFSPYDASGNRGIGCYVEQVIKTRDGERLAGGISADDAFGDLGEEEDALS